MSIKILHIDDDPLILEETKSLLLNFEETIYLGGFDSFNTAMDCIETKQPDLIILDLMLGDEISLECEDLGQIKSQVAILSGHTHYAFQAYQEGIVHYIQKPARIADFEELLQRVKKNLRSSAENNLGDLLNTIRNYSSQAGISLKRKKVAIVTAGKTYLEPSENIEYIEADGSYTVFHLTDNKTITSGKVFKTYNDIILENNNFVKISRSAIVNINHIKIIQRDKNKLSLKMLGGAILNVSSALKSEVLERIEC